MIVKDTLPDHPLERIEVRTNSPVDDSPDGILFGFCAWDGEKLISLDEDNYYIDEEVIKYEWKDNSLTYWIKNKWI